MLDDPMLLPRAASIISGAARECRVGAAAGVRSSRRDFRRGRRSLPARAEGRSGRRRRTRPDEPDSWRSQDFATCWVSARRHACSSRTSCRRRLRRSSTGASFRRSLPTPAAARITRPFSRARSTSRRSSGCTMRPRRSRPARSSSSMAKKGRCRSIRRRIWSNRWCRARAVRAGRWSA